MMNKATITFNYSADRYEDTDGNIADVSFFGSTVGAERAIKSLTQCRNTVNCMNGFRLNGKESITAFPGRS